MNNIFRKISTKVSDIAGSGPTFLIAVAVVVIWACSGPLFGFSDTWQLVINTSTTIITFLMVFLIQNTQNRDGRAVQLKLDELIRSSTEARDEFVDIEELTDQELDTLDREFQRLHELYADKPIPSLHKVHHKIIETRKHRQSSK